MEIHKTNKLLSVCAAASFILRLLPHPPNFAPIGGLALNSGIHGKSLKVLALPLIILFLSDIFIGFYDLKIMFSVYLSFFAISLIGRLFQNQTSVKNLFLLSLSGSLIFFLITNFAVWAFSPMYSKTVFGLLESYWNAILFLRNTIIGDLFYSYFFLMTFSIAKIKTEARRTSLNKIAFIRLQ